MCVNTIYPRKERAANEAEYTQNGEGCYIPGCQTAEGWICLDGTRAFSYVGRFSNHAPRSVDSLQTSTHQQQVEGRFLGRSQHSEG